MQRRGVSLSFNTVIIAALGLFVLAILIYIIGSSSGNFQDGTACNRLKGQCQAEDQCKPAHKLDDRESTPDNNGCPSGQVCCSIVPVR